MESSSPSSPTPSPAAAVAGRGPSNARLRWGILRRSLLARSSSCRSGDTSAIEQNKEDINNITRRTLHGFNLIEYHSLLDRQLMETLETSLNGNDIAYQKDVYICYKLHCGDSSKLTLVYRREDSLELNDVEASNRHNVDTTGLVCCWPSEDVLAYYCINHSDMFRSKRVLELGSGYGLAGFVIAACTDAREVVISDGNPQVVHYIERSIHINAEVFGETKVKSMILHWNQEQASDMLNSFDVIVASDCTFFKQFHESLARVVKSLLKQSEASQAIFLSPKRGDSLDKFLQMTIENGLCYELIENYDPTVWNLHRKFVGGGDSSWPNYDEEHCYPLLVRINFCRE